MTLDRRSGTGGTAIAVGQSFNPSRLARLRNGLTRGEWWRVGAIAAVVLSMAAMWSASKAWRRPRV